MVEWKEIRELFDTRNGYTPSTKEDGFWIDGTIPWFKMDDIRENGTILDDSKLHITEKAVKGKGLFNPNSIILATSATIGEHALITVKHLCNQRFTNLFPKKNYENRVNMRFFYYYMFLVDEWCKQHTHQGGFASVDMEGLYKYLVPIPSLSEQNRIVGILDTFTSSIDNLKQQIAQRRKQYEYYRDQLLDLEGKEGVEMKILRSIVKSYCTGATPNKGHSEYYEAGTIPWLRTQDVKFNEIYDIDTFVTDEAVEKTGVKWIPANCVIVAISGATAGRCAINKIPTTTNQHCLNLEINPKIALYKYVFYCVYNAYSDMVSRKQGARGDLNSSIILGITIPLPPLREQQRIVSILDTFEASIQNLETQLSQREKQYEYYRNKLLTFE